MTTGETKISDVVALLQKVAQTAGDLPVVLHDIEHGVVTELQHVGVTLRITGDPEGGCVTLAHAPVTATSTAPATAATAAEDAGA